MHHRLLPHLLQQRLGLILQLLAHVVGQLDDLPHAQVQVVQRGQITLNLAHAQAQRGAQVAHQCRNPHADAALAQDLAREV
jgi:hypothetical protein